MSRHIGNKNINPDEQKRLAFEILYKRYFNPLLNFGLQLTEDRQLVENVLQNSFLWIYENPENLNQIKNIEVYLFVTIKKNIQSALSKKQRSQNSFIRYMLRSDTCQIAESTEIKTLKEDQKNSIAQSAQNAYQSLPPKLREVVYLRYFEGFTNSEIANILSTSPQVIRNYNSRALKILRQTIQPIAVYAQVILNPFF